MIEERKQRDVVHYPDGDLSNPKPYYPEPHPGAAADNGEEQAPAETATAEEGNDGESDGA